MSLLLNILFVLLAIIALILIIASFSKKDYLIKREIIINTPIKLAFNYLKLLKNQDFYNKWVMVDPNMSRDFKGIDGTVGFVYGWNGNNKAGAGEQEIISIVEDKIIETEIRFIRPFAGVSIAKFELESLSENQTKITWSNSSTMKYPMNVMLFMIEKMLANDMDVSLTNLKKILEK